MTHLHAVSSGGLIALANHYKVIEVRMRKMRKRSIIPGVDDELCFDYRHDNMFDDEILIE